MIQVGDWVRIIKNDGYHNFEVGQIVRVVDLPVHSIGNFRLEGFVKGWSTPDIGYQFVPRDNFEKVE